MKRTIQLLLVLVLLAITFKAIHEVQTDKNQLRLKEIKIKNIHKDLESLESDYNTLDKTKQEEIDKLRKREQELEKQLEARRLLKQQEAKAYAAEQRKAQQKPSTQAVAPKLSSGCNAIRQQLASLGVAANELDAAITLAQRESSCSHTAVNKSSGACGVFQSYPCGKWGKSGTTEYMRGAIDYVRGRYGNYNAALAHSYANNWY